MILQHTPYRAPRWLPGAHLQTIWPLLIKRSLPLPNYHRERLSTPDGDFVDLDWLNHIPKSDAPTARGASKAGAVCPSMAAPLILLLHGLEGSSSSHYARALMHAIAAQGWRGAVLNFRGCSGTPNLLPRAYHSGDSAEITWLLKLLRQRNPDTPLFAVGVSLGGNALLKSLGEEGQHTVLDAAVAISVPYDLAAADACLSRGFARTYAKHFLASLIPSTLAKAQRFPQHPVLAQTARIRAARTLREFDDAVTAPLHGFRDADDYYSHSSSGQYLRYISTPTLLIHAQNDPFLPVSAIPLVADLPRQISLESFATGGHAGFVSGAPLGQIDWLPQRILSYFQAQIPAQTVP